MSEMNADTTIGALRRLLDETSVHAAVTWSNLANVDTPGFRAQRAEFAEPVRQPRRRDRGAATARHLARGAGQRLPAQLHDAPASRHGAWTATRSTSTWR